MQKAYVFPIASSEDFIRIEKQNSYDIQNNQQAMSRGPL